MTNADLSSWDQLQWKRHLETFSEDGTPMIATGLDGAADGVCQPGELTDKGRETTLALGQRFHRLYVDQLGFMPKVLADPDGVFLRATPMPRAMESVQQVFWGMYPKTARAPSLPPLAITTRMPSDETLYPNDTACQRFKQLTEAFAQRAADKWNETDEMRYINKLIGKWIPKDSPKVQVDSHPRLSGIMDTINATLAHGEATRLPKEFYDPMLIQNIEKIGVEEWFSGYQESQEYRTLGIGGVVGDVVAQMLRSVEQIGRDHLPHVGSETRSVGTRRSGENRVKFAMSGCHDTTLAGFLAGFGTFKKNDSWPPFTSHIAVELFRQQDGTSDTLTNPDTTHPKAISGWLSSIRGSSGQSAPVSRSNSNSFHRRPFSDFSAEEKKSLHGYFVRVRYNDEPVVIPGCRLSGNHLDGDESFCTLEAFKRIADKFTPRNWKDACKCNLDKPALPKETEEAGYY